MFKNNKAFTLIEMLIVLSVISVLILLIAPNLGKSNQNIQQKGCQALVGLVKSQVQLYYLEEETYPEDLEVLVANDYLESDQLVCPNDKEIYYDKDTGEVSIDEQD